MKLIIDIPDSTYEAIMARDWKNAGWLFGEELKAIHDGTPIPNNATNGDKEYTVPAIPISVIEDIKSEILNKENFSIGTEIYRNGELFDVDISVGVVLEIIDRVIKEIEI